VKGEASHEFALNEWGLLPGRVGVALRLRTVRSKTHKMTVDLILEMENCTIWNLIPMSSIICPTTLVPQNFVKRCKAIFPTKSMMPSQIKRP